LRGIYNKKLAAGAEAADLSFFRKLQKRTLTIIEKKDLSYSEFTDELNKFSDAAGVALDVIGVGLDAYAVGENIARLVRGDGNVTVNSLNLTQNAYNLVTGSAGLIAKIVPKGTIASSKFTKFFANSKVLKKTNVLILALQLNSMAYSAARDGIIEDTKESYFGIYENILAGRLTMYSSLLAAYREDSNISY
jgi:hypothetical protein